MTMAARVAENTKDLDIHLTRERLKQLYKQNHITQQKMIKKPISVPLPTTTKMEQQKRNIEYAQQKISYCMGLGYEVL